MTGLTVLVNGSVEARLLPTPTLTFGRIEIARRGDSRALRARSVSLEFSLAAMMRGEWRANEVRVEGAEFAAGLDPTGRLDWPAPAFSNELESLSIDRLDIVTAAWCLTTRRAVRRSCSTSWISVASSSPGWARSRAKAPLSWRVTAIRSGLRQTALAATPECACGSILIRSTGQ